MSQQDKSESSGTPLADTDWRQWKKHGRTIYAPHPTGGFIFFAIFQAEQASEAELDAYVTKASAAPELYEALRGMLALDEANHQRYPGDEDVCGEVRAARAALAKATGSHQ